jgi:hypothetical protein
MNYFSLTYQTFFLLWILILPFETKKNLKEECDVTEFYEAIESEIGSKVLTTNGELEEIDILLTPLKLEEGKYNIKVSRLGDNIYKVEGTRYYIETLYCYEYSNYDEAILIVSTNDGVLKGKVYFDL